MPGFSTLPWKISRCLACSARRSPCVHENIPPWCRFFQSLSVHMQICKRDSHQCRMSPEARSPETPDRTNQSVTDVVMTSCPARVVRSSYLFLCGLRVENLVHFKNTDLSFIKHTEWGLIVGICGHHHRLALVVLLVLLQHRLHAAQHTDVACKHRSKFITFLLCDDFISLRTFEFHQLLVVLPAQCNLFPVFLKKIFVGFGHLGNGCGYLPNNGRFTSDLWLLQVTKSWLNITLRTCFFASLIAAP